MPVCRRTRCRIFRMAAGSSTTRTSDSIRLLTSYSSEGMRLFIRAGRVKLTVSAGEARVPSKSTIGIKLSRKVSINSPGARTVSRQLSQQEIDAVFQNMQERKRETPAVKFDFRRPD